MRNFTLRGIKEEERIVKRTVYLDLLKAEIHFPSNSIKLIILSQNHPIVFKNNLFNFRIVLDLDSNHSILAPFLRTENQKKTGGFFPAEYKISLKILVIKEIKKLNTYVTHLHLYVAVIGT